MGASQGRPAADHGDDYHNSFSQHSDLFAARSVLNHQGQAAPALALEEVRLAEYAAQSQRLIHDIRMARTSEQSQRAIQQLEKLHADVQDVVQQVLQQNNKLRQRTHKQTRLLKMQDKSLKSWRSLCQN
ncbi:uncharacterized protein LOC112571095 [Pomacea canaliculata]|uniref:uncharacterized protein LOC112571095 n=1 Tax=Pomacea canaliculata TaxID=400727 RepID=UPI000D72B42D|nr:uncharacterized protein LOC112571095 [Pomacea canaliculata]